ncbi:polysaccharide biosynthesis protein [Clostridium puniceum]|uniref:Polysaccharide biosynthesis protein n=2 Tax=Clostridium puniceum TaxID=29367 RepID=A0A1S8TDV6_9CLOT|nr:polysaccharide biosynthesis protein [Clostridium puniceum]
MEVINYKKASTYYLVGNLFNKGISFLTVPIFTRILSTYDYGIVTTYTSWIGILSMILGFALHMGIRASFIDNKEKVDDFISVTSFFTIVSSASIGLIVVLGIILLRVNISLTLIILCLFESFSSAIIQDYSYYLMMKYCYKFRTFLMILPNLIGTIASILAILFVVKTNLYMGKIIPNSIINIIFCISLLILIFRKSHMLTNWNYLKYGLTISVPLIIHGISLNILSQSDRIMITWLADASQTGIYSIVYNFGMIATVITTSLEGGWIPWFTEKLKVRDIKSINNLVIDYVNLMTYAMVFLLLVGPEILKILASKTYWEGISIIPPVILANYLIFMYTLYVNVEHFYKRTIYITVNTLISAATNLMFNYIFIPQYGYVAAAYTTLASYLLSFILHAKYAKKLEADLYPLKTFIRPVAHILVVTILFYALINMPVIRWILMIIYLIAMLIREHTRILELFPELGNKLHIKHKFLSSSNWRIHEMDSEVKKKDKQNVFIIGSKGIPAKYGGFESFVEKLTFYKKSQDIQYYVYCVIYGKKEFKEIEKTYTHNGAKCFNIKALNIGPAKAVFYDLDALKGCISYIKENNIQNPIIYILACRIGPFIGHYKNVIKKLGGYLYVNPDGHEWKRAKWSAIVRKYWKLSEKLMVKHADLLICDSKNIEKYVQEDYKKYKPNTTFIAYGAETSKSNLTDDDPQVIGWYDKKGVRPKEYYLVVGRFVPENNFEIMIREFMKSKTKKDFVLVTDYEGISFYDKLKVKTGFDKDSRIKFVGTVYDQELLKKIRENAYGYFHGHEVGGTNPSLLEALGSTDFNLLLDVGFNREVGEDGALYWTKEDGSLANLIYEGDKMMEEKIADLSNRAKKRINDYYSWDYIVSRYEEVFKKMNG